MIKLNFNPFPNLSTERLNLRKMVLEDKEDIFKLRSDKEVSKYLDRQLYKSVDEAVKFIDRINDGIAKDKWIYWIITLKDENKLIGTICLWNIDNENSRAEIGYELIPSFMGKGVAQEAMTAVIGYGFEGMELEHIEAITHPENSKSIRLLERNGFGKEGSLRENDQELLIYVLER